LFLKLFRAAQQNIFYKTWKENIISCRSNKNAFCDEFVSSIPVIFSSKFRIAKIHGLYVYLFKLSSRLIVERHLSTIASDAYGIGLVEETRTTRDQYCGCVATISDRNFFTRIRSNSLGS
jgi:hypothetical protein